MRRTEVDTPISNFETNTGSFRRTPTPGAAGHAMPPERLKRRAMDIEDALSWAFRDELPKADLAGGSLGAPGYPSVSPMFSMVAFGMRIDNWSREPGFPAAAGAPHPDAVKIGAAVEALARFAEQPIGTDLDLGAGLAALGADEEGAMRKALRGLVATIQTCAKLGKRPFWSAQITPEPMRASSGKPRVVRWETVTRDAWGEGRTVEREELVPVEVRVKNVYPTGSHCPLQFSPDVQVVANERAEYAAWWAALNALFEDLAGQLTSIALIPPGAAERPWMGDVEQAKPPRVFADLTARVYKNQARQTAAAYRSIGARCSFGRRGAGPAVMAPRRDLVREQALA